MGLKDIYSGWRNLLTGEVTQQQRDRASVCSGCEHKKKSKIEIILPSGKDTEFIDGYVCNACDSVIKCPLQTKIRTEEKICDKWES